jgi:ribosomal protein L30E
MYDGNESLLGIVRGCVQQIALLAFIEQGESSI